jgi:RHS repeat-associated protein
VQEKRVGDITQLITGPGIDDYLSRITTTTGATPTTTTRNYLTDFLGSTTALADDAGAIKTTYGYEPYGEATVSGEATVNSFQYTGRENDGTGLMYYRARYYHPKAKRFISEDPAGQEGGLNIYAYVDGDPLGYVDALGLARNEVDTGAGRVGNGINPTPQPVPRFPGVKDHAHRHGEGKTSSQYYSDAVFNATRGDLRFRIKHDGQDKICYVTRTGPDKFDYTSLVKNETVIMTHMPVNRKAE